MGTRVNLAVLALLALAWLGLSARAPARIIVEVASSSLGPLEESVASDRSDGAALLALSEAYVDAGYPALAVVTLLRADHALLDEPAVAHQLARAYELSGRLRQAVAAADLAFHRCVSLLEPVNSARPTTACDELMLTRLDRHKSALERMVRWGVVDPRVDPRAERAYERGVCGLRRLY